MAGFFLPFGFDSADGTTPLPPQPLGATGSNETVGTPPPVDDVLVYSNDGSTPTVENEPDFPLIERAEQATSQSKLKMSWAACLNYIGVTGRGTFVSDTKGQVWRILSSQIQRFRSGQKMGIFSCTAESISFDSPPDEYQMIPVELGINIIKHPRYFYALYPTQIDFNTIVTLNGGAGGQTTSVGNLKQAIIRSIQTYQDSPYFPTSASLSINLDTNGLLQNQIISSISNSVVYITIDGVTYTYNNTTDTIYEISLAFAAAAEIIQKLWYQLDSPYLAGFQVTWSQYYFAPVFENPGGYIESPVGIVPDYFMSPSQSGSNTIFDQMASINPQCYSADGSVDGTVNISWLRKADEVEYQRTWFKVTRTWIGSPIGHWDPQLFSQFPLPGLNTPVSQGGYLPLSN
jgi:hypothetical protein